MVWDFWEPMPKWAKRLERKIMTAFDDLKANLDAIGADVGVVQNGITSLNSKITDLQAQLSAAGTVIPPNAQASLDAAVKESGNIKTQMDALASALTPTPVHPAA